MRAAGNMLPALWIGTMVALLSACVEGLDSEARGASSSTGPEHGDASIHSPRRSLPILPVTRMPADQLEVARFEAGLPDAFGNAHDDAGDDTDAGAPDSEFERAIAYDCTETVLCMGTPRNIAQCVVAVREALSSATPAQRQAFSDNVMRCREQQACGYVDCIAKRAP